MFKGEIWRGPAARVLSWVGSDRFALVELCGSRLDYASFISGTARKSYIKILNAIYHQGLRLVLGAFRTSPVESLTEAGENAENLRRIKLEIQYYVKIKSCSTKPAYRSTFDPNYYD